VKTTLPPNVSRVPTLLLVNNKFTAVVGDDIYTYVNANVKKEQASASASSPHLAMENGGEPVGYIISPSSGGVNIVSETFTMYNAPPEELAGKGRGATRQMHNYVSADIDVQSIPTPIEESIRQKDSPRQKSSVSHLPANNSLPTNPTNYNAFSVPGVLNNTGNMFVPELQRPPAHRHSKLGEDTTIESIQQQRNLEFNNSLPFIAKQLNHMISPEISNVKPPERYVSNKIGIGI
jgi:hypothetical protein